MGDRHHKASWKLITSGVVWKLVRGMCFSRTKEERTKKMRNSGKAYPPPERSERSLRIRADLQRSHVRLKQEGGTSLGAQW